MSRNLYQPGAIKDVEVCREDHKWTLVLHCHWSHSPQKVWSVLTEPAQLSQWAPFDADRNLGHTGPAFLTMAGDDLSEQLSISVHRADPPAHLTYTWGDDHLQWEIQATPSGTHLTLRHTLEDQTWIPKIAAGWHICLDVADQWMAGSAIGRIVGDEARQYGWEVLNEAYAARLGIGSTGWPA